MPDQEVKSEPINQPQEETVLPEEKADPIILKDDDADTQDNTPSPEDEKKGVNLQNSLSEISTEADSSIPWLPEKHILDIFFDFLRTTEERNPVLCGYYVKML